MLKHIYDTNMFFFNSQRTLAIMILLESLNVNQYVRSTVHHATAVQACKAHRPTLPLALTYFLTFFNPNQPKSNLCQPFKHVLIASAGRTKLSCTHVYSPHQIKQLNLCQILFETESDNFNA